MVVASQTAYCVRASAAAAPPRPRASRRTGDRVVTGSVFCSLMQLKLKQFFQPSGKATAAKPKAVATAGGLAACPRGRTDMS